MTLLIISASLKPVSRSRVLAREALRVATINGPAVLYDLRDHPLPLCDGTTSYGHPSVAVLAAAIRAASAVLIAAPVYNYDLNAAAKNLIENTGKAWEDKVVGFMLAAGGQRSYMAAQAFAGSLALDFRCLVVPRFVYTTREAFTPAADAIADPEVATRVAELVAATTRLSLAVHGTPATLPG